MVQICMRSFYCGFGEQQASPESKLSLMTQIKDEWLARNLMSLAAAETTADIISDVRIILAFP